MSVKDYAAKDKGDLSRLILHLTVNFFIKFFIIRKLAKFTCHRRSRSGVWIGRWSHHIYTSPRPQIPEPDCLVL